MNRWLIW